MRVSSTTKPEAVGILHVVIEWRRHVPVVAKIGRWGQLTGFALVCALGSAQQPQHSATVQRAAELLSRGDARGAVPLYKEAVKETPNDPAIHYNLGIALGTIGQREEQRRALERTIELDPDFAMGHNQLGLLELEGGNFGAAETHFRKAISSDPQFAEAVNNLGVLRLRQKKLEEASQLFRNALKLDPKYIQAHLNLTSVLLEQGNVAQAETHARQALRFAPNSAAVLTAFGKVQTRQGRLDEAATTFRSVISQEPDSPEAHFNLGIALGEKMDLPGAVARSRRPPG